MTIAVASMKGLRTTSASVEQRISIARLMNAYSGLSTARPVSMMGVLKDCTCFAPAMITSPIWGMK